MPKYEKDALGSRMKAQYEDRCRFFLPRRTYTILRVDGKAFHTWTRGLAKPYDTDFMSCMDAAAVALCKEIAGARFAFVQSDEISVLVTDFENESSQAWFDGNIQKWVSVASGVATAAFNAEVSDIRESAARHDIEVVGKVRPISKKVPSAVFDARVFTIPDPIEVENYFIWRQKDAERNSVTLLASAYASHKQLHAKSITARHEIISNGGDNWRKHPVRFRHGGIVRRFVKTDIETMNGVAAHTQWKVDEETPVFTKDRDYLRDRIPRHWEGDDKTVKRAAAHA